MSTSQHKRRALFWTDVLLIPVFVATGVTGVGLYYAGLYEPHEVWENWSLAHVVSAVLWLGLGIYHIYRHWAWYKSLFRSSNGKKSKVTLLLSVVFLVMVITGILLLAIVNGPNSLIGKWHFWLGVAIIVLSLAHIIMRWDVLKKLNKKE